MSDETQAPPDGDSTPAAPEEPLAEPASATEPGQEPAEPARQAAAPEPDDGRERTQPEPFAEEDIRPDSLRVESRVGEELFGARSERTVYTGTMSYGPAAFGNHNSIYVYNDGQRAAKPIISPLQYVSDLLDVYAPTSADKPLDEVLGYRHTACLTGGSGTGRFSTACAALARRHGADRVHEVLLPAGAAPEDLHRDADRLTDGHGYVLRLPGDGHAQAMRQLADVFRQRSASLLLIKDDSSRAGGRHSAEVLHRRAESREIFRRHLRWRLRRNGSITEDSERHADAYLKDEGLGLALDQAYGPKEVVTIAHAVAVGHPVDSDTMADILAASQPRRRERAAQILLPERSGEVMRHHRLGQHERAFRISYAVFYRQPLHYVFESAGKLLERIDGEASRPYLGRPALEHPVSELLGSALALDWQEGRGTVQSLAGASRSAWLRDPGMRGAIIDVAWHEFDNTRPALLKWLDQLVHEGDEPVRRAAAETAGLLAHHDFDRVHADLVDGWAAAQSPRLRQAAAWTLVTADLGGQVGHLVRVKVREWASGRWNNQRDTAARVYASGLQQPYLGWSLADLRRIAEDRMQRDTQIIAEGVNQLFTPDRGGWLISELAEWVGEPPLQKHAARALLTLAAKQTDDVSSGHPELLMRLAANEVGVAELARIWRVALLDASTSRRGCEVLGRWLRHADVDDALRKSVAELLHDLAHSPPVRRRLQFYLPRMWRSVAAQPKWVDIAMKEP